MNIHVIVQVKKIQEFDVIQVLFKPSSIFQRIDFCIDNVLLHLNESWNLIGQQHFGR